MEQQRSFKKGTLAHRIYEWDSTHKYSDIYIESAAEEEDSLIKILKSLKCPYTLDMCVKAVHGEIVDLYCRDSDGRYYHKKWKPDWLMYRPEESELLTREEADSILDWLNTHNIE